MLHLETRPLRQVGVVLGYLIDIPVLGHTYLDIMVIPYISLLVIWQGQLSMRYHFFQKISWDNFPCHCCQMTTKDIPEISFWELSMGYPWDSPCQLEISMIPIPYQRYLLSVNDLSQGYLLALRIPAAYQWPSLGPRDISCCFRNRLTECSQQWNPPAKFQHSAADGSSSKTRFTVSFPWKKSEK